MDQEERNAAVPPQLQACLSSPFLYLQYNVPNGFISGRGCFHKSAETPEEEIIYLTLDGIKLVLDQIDTATQMAA